MLVLVSLFVVAVLVSGFSLAGTASRADEWPAGTDTIEPLKTEQATAPAKQKGDREAERACLTMDGR